MPRWQHQNTVHTGHLSKGSPRSSKAHPPASQLWIKTCPIMPHVSPFGTKPVYNSKKIDDKWKQRNFWKSPKYQFQSARHMKSFLAPNKTFSFPHNSYRFHFFPLYVKVDTCQDGKFLRSICQKYITVNCTLKHRFVCMHVELYKLIPASYGFYLVSKHFNLVLWQ